MISITWTRELRDKFAVAYEEAVAQRKDVFTFDGHEFVTSYAKYLLQYLDSQLIAQPRRTYARSRGGR